MISQELYIYLYQVDYQECFFVIVVKFYASWESIENINACNEFEPASRVCQVIISGLQ